MRSTRSPKPLHFLLSSPSAASNTVLTFPITIYINHIYRHSCYFFIAVLSSIKSVSSVNCKAVQTLFNSVNNMNNVKCSATSISDSIFCSFLIFEQSFFRRCAAEAKVKYHNSMVGDDQGAEY